MKALPTGQYACFCRLQFFFQNRNFCILFSLMKKHSMIIEPFCINSDSAVQTFRINACFI